MRVDSENPLTSALAGLQVGVKHARDAADEVAKLSTGSNEVRDAVKPLLDMQKAETEVAVNSKVVKAQDETLGTLIDTSA